jgi:hypothetical protein
MPDAELCQRAADLAEVLLVDFAAASGVRK